MRYINLLLTLTVTLPACRHADYMRHELQTNCVKVMRARLKKLAALCGVYPRNGSRLFLAVLAISCFLGKTPPHQTRQDCRACLSTAAATGQAGSCV